MKRQPRRDVERTIVPTGRRVCRWEAIGSRRPCCCALTSSRNCRTAQTASTRTTGAARCPGLAAAGRCSIPGSAAAGGPPRRARRRRICKTRITRSPPTSGFSFRPRHSVIRPRVGVQRVGADAPGGRAIKRLIDAAREACAARCPQIRIEKYRLAGGSETALWAFGNDGFDTLSSS